MDSQQIQDLFAQTVVGDYEGEEAWAAVSALRSAGNREIFDRAKEWSHAADPLKRARGVAILCQLRKPSVPNGPSWEPEWIYRDESYPIITEMLQSEQYPAVLDSAISALGHLGRPEAISLILTFQEHADKDVRFAVTFALGCFPNETPAVTCLMKLTRDPEPEVRDWAVFGLGVQGDCDSSEIREVLLRCLRDGDVNVREEAAIGLGKRHDQRLIPVLWTMLETPDISVRVGEASAALLELDEDPPIWSAADYRAALRQKFNLQF
jgi:hypothetical protein